VYVLQLVNHSQGGRPNKPFAYNSPTAHTFLPVKVDTDASLPPNCQTEIELHHTHEGRKLHDTTVWINYLHYFDCQEAVSKQEKMEI